MGLRHQGPKTAPRPPQDGQSKNKGRPVHRPVGVFNPAALRVERSCRSRAKPNQGTLKSSLPGSQSRRGRTAYLTLFGTENRQKPMVFLSFWHIFALKLLLSSQSFFHTHFYAQDGPKIAHVLRSWAVWGPSWTILGPILGHFGAILGPSWGHFPL